MAARDGTGSFTEASAILNPMAQGQDAMVEDELRQRVALAEEQLSSRPRLATCGHYDRVTRLARAPGVPRPLRGR